MHRDQPEALAPAAVPGEFVVGGRTEQLTQLRAVGLPDRLRADVGVGEAVQKSFRCRAVLRAGLMPILDSRMKVTNSMTSAIWPMSSTIRSIA